MNTKETAEHVLHREELERRIENLEEIIRVQADTIATQRATIRSAMAGIESAASLAPVRVHGGQRA